MMKKLNQSPSNGLNQKPGSSQNQQPSVPKSQYSVAKRFTYKVPTGKTNGGHVKLSSPKMSFKREIPSEIESQCASIAQEQDNFKQEKQDYRVKSMISSFSNKSLSSMEERSSSACSNSASLMAVTQNCGQIQSMNQMQKVLTNYTHNDENNGATYRKYTDFQISDKDDLMMSNNPNSRFHAGKSFKLDNEINILSKQKRDKQTTPIITPSICGGGPSRETDRSRQSMQDNQLSSRKAGSNYDYSKLVKPDISQSKTFITKSSTTKNVKKQEAKESIKHVTKKQSNIILQKGKQIGQINSKQINLDQSAQSSHQAMVAALSHMTKQQIDLQQKRQSPNFDHEINSSSDDYIQQESAEEQSHEKSQINQTKILMRQPVSNYNHRVEHSAQMSLKKDSQSNAVSFSMVRDFQDSSRHAQPGLGQERFYYSAIKNDNHNSNNFERILQTMNLSVDQQSNADQPQIYEHTGQKQDQNKLQMPPHVSENYLSNGAGGGAGITYNSNYPRKPSANRPHDSAQAQNQSKIDQLNSSGKNFFHHLNNQSVSIVNKNSTLLGFGNGLPSPTGPGYSLQKQKQQFNSATKHQESSLMVEPSKGGVSLNVNQVYNSQNVIKNGFDRHSPKVKYKNMMFNVQTPTGYNQQKFQSPFVLTAKSTSQGDLRSAVKSTEQNQKKRTGQEVREPSYKKSVLAYESKEPLTSSKNGSLTQKSNFVKTKINKPSPRGLQQQRRIGSIDTSNHNNQVYNVVGSRPISNSINQKIVTQSQYQDASKRFQQEQVANKPRDTAFIKQTQIPRQLDYDTTEEMHEGFGMLSKYQRSSTFKSPTIIQNDIGYLNKHVTNNSTSVNYDLSQYANVQLVQNQLERKTTDERSQLSLLSKFKSFFKKDVNDLSKIETQTPENQQNADLPPLPLRQFSVIDTSNKINRNLDSYPELFSPIQEEKTPHRDALDQFDGYPDIQGFERNIRSNTIFPSQQSSKNVQTGIRSSHASGNPMILKKEQSNKDKNLSHIEVAEFQLISPIAPPEEIKFTCGCAMEPGIQYACKRANNWLKILNKNKRVDIDKMKELYYDLLACGELKEYEDQIKKDLARTFPKCPQFQDIQGQQALKRVLLAFSRYDHSLGYVQGMNFIVGSMLYHCNEEIAFWMFVTLIEAFELREIYEPGLPGLYKQCFMIETMIEQNIPDLSEHFKEHNILVEMYGSDWIFCLFSNIIPLQFMGEFYDLFFESGWNFFYRFCLSMLGVFKDKLLEEDEFSGILSYIKFKTPEKHIDSDHPFASASKTSPRQNQVFVFDESTGSLTKKSIIHQQKRTRFQRLMDLLLKKQDGGIWEKIFTMSDSWNVTNDGIKKINDQYDKSKVQVVEVEEVKTPLKSRPSKKFGNKLDVNDPNVRPHF